MVLSRSLVALFVLAATTSALPVAPRAINIEHTSASTGETTVHSIDEATLAPAIANALKSNELNIKLTGDKLRQRSGISNSTINLTVIDPSKAAAQKRNMIMKRARTMAIVQKAKRAAEDTTGSSSHNVHIDASSSGNGTGGGIHNSTVNINLIHGRRAPETTVGDHSVLVDTSSAAGQEQEASSGIEDSTVHVNILPRATEKTIGDHSILIDSSSTTEKTTSAGDHSAVVDTSSTSSSPSKGIKSSTINLTVVSPIDSSTSNTEAAASAPVKRDNPKWAQLRKTQAGRA